jgi:cytochrome c2
MPNLISTVLRAAAGLAAIFLLVTLAACTKPGQGNDGPSATQSSSDRGNNLIGKLGCGSCHVIPGIQDADGMVGPPLDHIASRLYIAGVLRNTPANMVTWLRHPQQIVPGNAMPDLGISEADGRDIAAYLATLK